MKDLKNKVAVVTGGSVGIGKGIAEHLAKEGCQVVLVARTQKDLDATADELSQRYKAEVKGYSCDLTDFEALKTTFDAIESDYGRIDILINNAGAGTFKPMDMMSYDEAILPVMLPYGAAVGACHRVIPGMLKRKCGHIVNMTSPSGFIPVPYMMPYASARAAMVAMSDCLYEELHPQGIGVSLICPPKVNTGYFDHNDADIKWWPKFESLVEMLEPDEVGKRTVAAIKKNKRTLIFPRKLDLMISMFNRMPRESIKLMDLMGLWRSKKS